MGAGPYVTIARPRAAYGRASAIDTVSFAILPVARPSTDKDGWTAVKVDKNRVGYISSAYVRCPIDYRAIFRFEDRRWRLVNFVAGD